MCTQINTSLNINVAFISVWYDSVTKSDDTITAISYSDPTWSNGVQSAHELYESALKLRSMWQRGNMVWQDFLILKVRILQFFLRKTSRCATSVPIKYNTLCTSSTTTILHARLHVSTLIIGHLQAALQLCFLCVSSPVVKLSSPLRGLSYSSFLLCFLHSSAL